MIAATTLVSDRTEPTDRSTSFAVRVMVWPTAMMIRMLAFLTMFRRLLEFKKTKPYSSERVRIAITAQTEINTMNRIAANLFAVSVAKFIGLLLSIESG